jgi:hypothetical protein
MLNSEAKCTSTHNGTLMRTRARRFNTKRLKRHMLVVTGQSVSILATICAALFTRELVLDSDIAQARCRSAPIVGRHLNLALN